MANGNGGYTVKEMIGELRIDLRADIAEIAHKVADLDRKLDLQVADHEREHTGAPWNTASSWASARAKASAASV